MKFFKKLKDGGPESSVIGYFLLEIKSLISVVLLRFEGKSRNAFHTHAFDALSWVLRGSLREELEGSGKVFYYHPCLKPIWTPRERFHKVEPIDLSRPAWVLSFRGPWRKEWKEFLPDSNQDVTLSNGRRVVDASPR